MSNDIWLPGPVEWVAGFRARRIAKRWSGGAEWKDVDRLQPIDPDAMARLEWAVLVRSGETIECPQSVAEWALGHGWLVEAQNTSGPHKSWMPLKANDDWVTWENIGGLVGTWVKRRWRVTVPGKPTPSEKMIDAVNKAHERTAESTLRFGPPDTAGPEAEQPEACEWCGAEKRVGASYPQEPRCCDLSNGRHCCREVGHTGDHVYCAALDNLHNVQRWSDETMLARPELPESLRGKCELWEVGTEDIDGDTVHCAKGPHRSSVGYPLGSLPDYGAIGGYYEVPDKDDPWRLVMDAPMCERMFDPFRNAWACSCPDQAEDSVPCPLRWVVVWKGEKP